MAYVWFMKSNNFTSGVGFGVYGLGSRPMTYIWFMKSNNFTSFVGFGVYG